MGAGGDTLGDSPVGEGGVGALEGGGGEAEVMSGGGGEEVEGGGLGLD